MINQNTLLMAFMEAWPEIFPILDKYYQKRLKREESLTARVGGIHFITDEISYLYAERQPTEFAPQLESVVGDLSRYSVDISMVPDSSPPLFDHKITEDRSLKISKNCIYLLWLDSVVVYVGMTKRGFLKRFQETHRRNKLFDEATIIEVGEEYKDSMELLEMKFIHTFHPYYNITHTKELYSHLELLSTDYLERYENSTAKLDSLHENGTKFAR